MNLDLNKKMEQALAVMQKKTGAEDEAQVVKEALVIYAMAIGYSERGLLVAVGSPDEVEGLIPVSGRGLDVAKVNAQYASGPE